MSNEDPNTVWDADAQASGEPAGQSPEVEEQASSEQPEETQQPEQAQAQPEKKPEEAAAPAQSPLDVEALAESIARAQQKTQQQAQASAPQPQRQLTEEEYRKMVNYAQIRPEHVQALAEGGEGAVQAMDEILQAGVRQALTVASMFVKQQLDNRFSALDERLTPYMSMADQMNIQRFENDFFTANPDLKQFGPLLNTVADQLSQQGFKPQNQQQAIDKAAELMRGMIKQFGLTPNASEQQSTQSQPAGGQPAMPTQSSGGQGGTRQQSSGGQGSKKDAAMSIWD
jgi:ATPase subunit of ABC transporter with duplicated ATPase domains